MTMIDTGHTLKLDQSHLETVIPAEGMLSNFKKHYKSTVDVI